MLFELAVSLLMAGLGVVAWVSNPSELKVPMLPWEGAILTEAMLFLGIIGVACVLLAGGMLRWVFPLWSLLVLVALVRGLFLSSYSFEGVNQFQFAVWFTLGALVAFLGSLEVLRKAGKR